MTGAPRKAGALGKCRACVDCALGWLLAGLMAASVVNVVWQVLTRYMLRNPSSYTEELARYLLVWIGLLGAAYAAGRGMHLAVDLLPAYLTGAPRRGLEIAIHLCAFLFGLGVMVWGGGRLVWMTLYVGQKSAAMRVPLGYVYLAIPIAGLLMAFFALAGIFGAGPPPSAPLAAAASDGEQSPEEKRRAEVAAGAASGG